MSDPDPNGGLFELGQQGLRDDDEGLRDLCKEFGINHNGPEAWRNLALWMARKYVPGFPYQKQLNAQALAESLRGKKSNAGRKPRPLKTRELMLRCVENWKQTHQRPSGPKRTDREALKSWLKDKLFVSAFFPDMTKADLPQIDRLRNILSETRSERKKRMRQRALVAALKRK